MSGGPVGVTFPNQFPLGNPENVSGKLEIHFDDLLIESICKPGAMMSAPPREELQARCQ